MRRLYRRDSLVIGFALFSMFFGAGNVIFPPYLGLQSGSQWLLGFVCYYLADIGLALVAIFAMLRRGSAESITQPIGRVGSTILMCVIILCIGPMLAIPRTAASTYEMALLPLFPKIGAPVFSAVFFLVIFLLCVRESAVVNIVGKVLTPVLLLGLIIMIVRGVVVPIGPVPAVPAVREGKAVRAEKPATEARNRRSGMPELTAKREKTARKVQSEKREKQDLP